MIRLQSFLQLLITLLLATLSTTKTPIKLVHSSISTTTIMKSTTTPPPPPINKRTNFIIFIIEDTGYGDWTFMMNNPLIKTINPNIQGKTPNLQSMANSKSTITFTNFHSPSATCSPSRAGMLTGRVSDRDCVKGPNTDATSKGFPETYQAPFPMAKDAPVITWDAQYFGYQTAIFGKWHLSNPLKLSPDQFGFQEFIVSSQNLPSWSPSCFCDVCLLAQDAKTCSRNSVGHNMCEFDIPIKTCYSPRISKQCYYGKSINYPASFQNWDCYMFEQQQQQQQLIPHKLFDTSPAEHVVDLFEQWLNTKHNLSQPFLVALTPNNVPFLGYPTATCETVLSNPSICSLLTPTEKALATDYYGTLLRMDNAIGKLRTVLKQHGISDNTLLLFTSDNGPEDFNRGGYGFVGTLRGRKREMFEGGHRVVSLMEWPQGFNSINQQQQQQSQLLLVNNRYNGLVSLLDWPVTISEIMRLEGKNKLNLDPFPLTLHREGISLLPLWKSWGVTLPVGNPNPSPAVQDRTLGICSSSYHGIPSCTSLAYYLGDYKFISITLGKKKQKKYLFNIQDDPNERVNLLYNKTSLFYRDITERIWKQAREWVFDVIDEGNRRCG
jgi:arylsulfatase A-like enzyme